MVKRLLTFVLLLTGSISMLAQNRTITGSLYDGELKEKVPFAVVQLLKRTVATSLVPHQTKQEALRLRLLITDATS